MTWGWGPADRAPRARGSVVLADDRASDASGMYE